MGWCVEYRGLAHSSNEDGQEITVFEEEDMDFSGLGTGPELQYLAPDFATGLMKDSEQVTAPFYSAWRTGITTV